jgi:hypothetical protein
VARRFGVEESAVRAYVGLHFDVLDRLDARYWVVQQVIGCTPGRTYTPKDQDVWLRLYGYLFPGTSVLDAVVAFFTAPDVFTGAGPVGLARLVAHLAVRAAVLCRCVPDHDPRAIILGQLAGLLDGRREDCGDVLAPLAGGADALEKALGL